MDREELLCLPFLLGKDVEWQMENAIAVFVIIILVGSAAAYLVKAKRSGVKCVGREEAAAVKIKEKKRN